MDTPTYTFRTTLWLYPGENPWHFITLPQKLSKEIRGLFGSIARGFGSLPIEITIGSSTWQTSIFPDTQSQSYVAPIKAAIRKKEGITEGDTITVRLTIRT